MNPDQDISDGVVEFEEQQARDRAETQLRNYPSMFTVQRDGMTVIAEEILQLILHGPRHDDGTILTSFDSGFLQARVRVIDGDGLPLPGKLVAEYRWARGVDPGTISKTEPAP